MDDDLQARSQMIRRTIHCRLLENRYWFKVKDSDVSRFGTGMDNGEMLSVGITTTGHHPGD
jgi:hypothetical protein